MQYYTGIDLGNRQVDITVINQKGEVQNQARLDANIESILPFLKPYKKKQRIVFESCSTYYWLSDGLEKAGYTDLTMAHALQLAHITKAKVKTDRRDSQKLAELHRMDYIPKSFIYPKELRPLRDLARRRMGLVHGRSGDYRALKQTLRRHGFEGPDRNAIVNLREEHLEDFFGHDLHLDYVLHDSLGFNEVYNDRIKRVENELDEGLKEDQVTKLLSELPGVGVWLSKYIRLEVESVDRFKNLKAFNSWCRVSPGVAQSGDKTTRGRGSKQGNAHMKYALMQAAANAIRLYPQVKAYYLAHVDRRRTSGGKMVSMNIIARKLNTAVWHCFHGRPYEPDRLFSIEGLSKESA